MKLASIPNPLLTFAFATAIALLIATGCSAPAASPTPTKAAAPAATAAPTTAPAAAPTQAAAPAAPTQAPAAAKIDYPTRSLELLVPFAAGGAADVAARKLTAMVEKDLGQPISISNVTGAGGAVAYQQIKNAKPDGYKLLWASAAMATLPAQGNIDFGYEAFDHAALVSAETVCMSVSSDNKAKTLKEFVDAAKSTSKPVNVGNSGLGSFTHLSAVAIADKTGAPFTHIAFGAGLAVTNLIGGHIDASVQHPAEILAAYKGNQIRLLGITSKDRIQAFKDVPTFKEQGYDLFLEQWRGISVTKGTPKPILDKLEAAFLKVAKSQEWSDYLATIGAFPKPMNSADMSKFVADQHTQIMDLSKKVKTDTK
ncbi:MAG TPA: tripartite tricarboxylate transporter substrate binding protein [Chloroflexota bacterium]|nr:tripartite tricarboxylate transporter substrate binding protein [Chloroflexota bacterium]